MRLCSLLFFCFSLLLFKVFGQSKTEEVSFYPAQPQQGESVKIIYEINRSIFTDTADRVFCRIYFTGHDKSFPRVFEPSLSEENGFLYGSFNIPEKSTGIVAVFLDTLKATIDNNNGEGYWTPIYRGSDLLPGSLASIANLYVRGWPPEYHLTQRKDIARNLYERDFSLHSETKRDFMQYYLATFNIYNAEDKRLFNEELNQYTRNTDLNEFELFDIKNYFSTLNEKDSSIKYEKLIFERFPHGSRAIQVNSLQPAINIELTKNPSEKWQKYQQFKLDFCQNYPDSFTLMRMNSRLGQLLRGMVLSFAQNNDLDTWEREIDELDEKSRYSTYIKSAKFIMDHLNSSTTWKKETSLNLNLETAQLRITSLDEEKLSLYAEKIIRESVNWFRLHINEPRELLDKPYITDNEIRSSRQEQLAMALAVLGQNLIFQNKVEEAQQVLKEAVELANRSESSINEQYIGSLIMTNQIDAAIIESTKVIGSGKSTALINNFHQRMSDDPSVREIALTDLKTQLKKQMINEAMPDGALVNGKGDKILLSELKGKTIVIDFWATWCAPCIIAMESMNQIVKQYEDQSDVVFLFINSESFNDETKAKAIRKLKELNYNFNVFFDPNLLTTKAFKVESLPTTFVIDIEGKIRFKTIGVNLKKGKQELRDELMTMIELAKSASIKKY